MLIEGRYYCDICGVRIDRGSCETRYAKVLISTCNDDEEGCTYLGVKYELCHRCTTDLWFRLKDEFFKNQEVWLRNMVENGIHYRKIVDLFAKRYLKHSTEEERKEYKGILERQILEGKYG